MYADELDPPERPESVYAAALARSVWRRAPTARVTYRPSEDSLVVELVETEPTHELAVDGGLLVELDGDDPDAHPVALYLSGMRTGGRSRAADRARDLVGERVWSAAEALAAARSAEPADVALQPEDALARRATWRAAVAWLGDRLRAVAPAASDTVIGVEVLPGRVTAVLTDDGRTVLEQVDERPTGNDPDTVVAAVARAVRRLAARHPGTDADRCPVGVQIGGPVERGTGTVRFYDKPLADGDEAWKLTPLGGLLRRATGRVVEVSNDAEALAAHELRHGTGLTCPTFALLVVGQGIGAALVHEGKVVEFPMEIGVFVPVPGAALGETPDRVDATIEAESGVRGIVAQVAALCGAERGVHDLASAAAEAAVPGVLDVFATAGAGLARGLAAVHAVVDPPRWVLYAPRELADETTPTGERFVAGLRTANRYLGYHGLHPVVLTSHRLDLWTGAVAAASVLTSR